MELKQEVLDQLKCCNCTGYLSSAPVLLTAAGESVCGQCSSPEESAVRNQPYELLAQHVTFPCKYQEEGCPERLPFGQQKIHEDGCGYRQYICPVVTSESCDWLGSREDLLEQCKNLHPNRVIKNSKVFRHDITKSSVHAYIMIAFDLLFLVHTKVCLTTRKIYHSVRYIGNPKHTAKYKFQIDVERKGSKLTREGKVEPQGCLYIKEDIAVHMGINSLLDILGGFKGTTFKLTISEVTELVNCVKCEKRVLHPTFQDAVGWRCNTCAPQTRSCENSLKGCSYVDTDDKAVKHELWYCEYSTHVCSSCDIVPAGSLAAHESSKHKSSTRKAGIPWRHTAAANNKERYVKSDVGILVCWCLVQPSEFTFWVYSPLSNEELGMYECELVLQNPFFGCTRRFKLQVCSDSPRDWEIELKGEDLRPYIDGDETKITIDIKKSKLSLNPLFEL